MKFRRLLRAEAPRSIDGSDFGVHRCLWKARQRQLVDAGQKTLCFPTWIELARQHRPLRFCGP